MIRDDAPAPAAPDRECDLVMKGGITSGVVYPRLLLEVAREYHLVNIGGTSAGAIAAGLAAAAEYGRASGGFERLAEVPSVLEDHLLDLFQPHPAHEKTFATLLKLMRRGSGWVARLRMILGAPLTLRRVIKSYRRLQETDYGLCPGLTRKGARHPALTDWLDRQLEAMAGRLDPDGELPERPLTFGDLAERGIALRAIASDLSGKVPVILPFQDRTWMFREEDLRRVFPVRVVDWLRRAGEPYEDDPSFLQLPEAGDLPVLFAVRASLAFPVLLAAIPLYRRDFSLRLDPEAMRTPRRCWLSDGGISSNFPIHLFDDLLPTRPTFGIALDRFDPARHHKDPTVPEGRVWLPDQAAEGTQKPIDAITGPLGFLGAILNTARNWQDTLQSVLPGYRERIVHVALTDDEGGLNLEMESETIAALVDYGERAGKLLTGSFAFDENRWRRFLSAYAAFEEAFESLVEGYDGGFREFLDRVEPRSYKPPSEEARRELAERLEKLVETVRPWTEKPLRDAWRSGMPRPRTHVKLVPREQAAGIGEGG